MAPDRNVTTTSMRARSGRTITFVCAVPHQHVLCASREAVVGHLELAFGVDHRDHLMTNDRDRLEKVITSSALDPEPQKKKPLRHYVSPSSSPTLDSLLARLCRILLTALFDKLLAFQVTKFPRTR